MRADPTRSHAFYKRFFVFGRRKHKTDRGGSLPVLRQGGGSSPLRSGATWVCAPARPRVSAAPATLRPAILSSRRPAVAAARASCDAMCARACHAGLCVRIFNTLDNFWPSAPLSGRFSRFLTSRSTSRQSFRSEPPQLSRFMLILHFGILRHATVPRIGYRLRV